MNYLEVYCMGVKNENTADINVVAYGKSFSKWL